MRHAANNDQTQKRSDLKLFLQNFRPEAAGVADTFPIIKIAGAQDQQGVLDADQLDAELNSEGDLDSAGRQSSCHGRRVGRHPLCLISPRPQTQTSRI
jgi:hypothetical protein